MSCRRQVLSHVHRAVRCSNALFVVQLVVVTRDPAGREPAGVTRDPAGPAGVTRDPAGCDPADVTRDPACRDPTGVTRDPAGPAGVTHDPAGCDPADVTRDPAYRDPAGVTRDPAGPAGVTRDPAGCDPARLTRDPARTCSAYDSTLSKLKTPCRLDLRQWFADRRRNASGAILRLSDPDTG